MQVIKHSQELGQKRAKGIIKKKYSDKDRKKERKSMEKQRGITQRKICRPACSIKTQGTELGATTKL